MVSPLLHMILHKVKALGGSIAKEYNVAMEGILTQCQWAHQTTFTSFYLRDTQAQKDELYLVVAVAITHRAPTSQSDRQ